MSTLTQFAGLGTSFTVTNLTTCITLTVDTTAPLGSRPKGTGGFLICKASSLLWIVAPRCAEVSRFWGDRDDANTLAKACTSFSGWFVPTLSQLQSPGYCCRTYWDSFSCTFYWSNNSYLFCGCGVNFSTGTAGRQSMFDEERVRAFRRVIY